MWQLKIRISLQTYDYSQTVIFPKIKHILMTKNCDNDNYVTKHILIEYNLHCLNSWRRSSPICTWSWAEGSQNNLYISQASVCNFLSSVSFIQLVNNSFLKFSKQSQGCCNWQELPCYPLIKPTSDFDMTFLTNSTEWRQKSPNKEDGYIVTTSFIWSHWLLLAISWESSDLCQREDNNDIISVCILLFT